MTPKDSKKQHSDPVPRFYKKCRKILIDFLDKKGTLKTLIYQEKPNDFKRFLGLLSRVVQDKSKLEAALIQSHLFNNEPKFDKTLALILAAELLKKDEELKGSCLPVQTINKYFHQIREYFNSETQRSSVQALRLPKYCRINTLLITPKNLLMLLSKEGLKQVKYGKSLSYEKYLQLVKELEVDTFLEDLHIEGLLVFSPKQVLIHTKAYRKNLIIIQDKASCLPPALCDFKPYANVIDACAAPGNKTSQIAAALQNRGRVVAFDKDQVRHKRLSEFMKLRGAKCVTTVQQDFTKVDPKEYEQFQTIIVDPSCSNSGVGVDEEELSSERLRKLSFFQYKILEHALSFPNVNTVIFSTCSVTEEENEKIVEKALEDHSGQFTLEDLHGKFNGWKNYGKSTYPFSQKCLRTTPEDDLCHGFFVAKFVRMCSSSSDDSPSSLIEIMRKSLEERSVNSTPSSKRIKLK